MKYPNFLKSINTKTKIVFWLTLALLMLFAMTPRGYAQELPAGTTTDPATGTTTTPAAPAQIPVVSPEMQQAAPENAAQAPAETAPTTFPYTRKFIISAYYTPLPGQSKYVTGSFEGDVRLNGEGVHSADGSLVYPGMAAAPKTFPFGTKMQIPGFGIVAIHDRGGAIKNSRLDIWVGRGEEGLGRAFGWGMRTLDVTVYGIDPNIKESVNFTDVPIASLASIPQKTKYFKSDIAFGDSGEEVRELQRFLSLLGFFDGAGQDVPGYFGNDTQAAVQAFQLSEKVIDSADDPGAGNFGPKSRYALESLLDRHEADMLKELSSGTLSRGDKGANVTALQNVLKDYGFLVGTTTGKFDDATFDALLRFQMDADIIQKPKDVGAGFYGPKTKAALTKLIQDTYSPSTSLIVRERSSEQPDEKVFAKNLQKNDKGSEVTILQEELRRLNFLGLKPTGYFGKMTEHAVFKFQQTFNIVADEKTSGAGVVGPKTQDKLNEIISLRTAQKKNISETTDRAELVSARVADEKMLVAGTVLPEMFGSDISYGTRGAEVERLQKILKRLGFFQGRLTSQYFGDITKNSLIAFQKGHGLAESGNLDAATREILNRIIEAPQS